jgi:hypothetical protein
MHDAFRLAAAGKAIPPYYNVVTDSISINSLWWRAGAAGWFVPNSDSADVMRRGGVAADLLHVTGFPVPAFFGEQAGRLTPPDLTVPGHAPRVLYIINSGTHHATETARRLLDEVSWEVTIAVGRDEPLRRALTLLFEGNAQVVFGDGEGDYRTLNFQQWRDLSAADPEADSSVSTISFRIRVPRVILLMSFDRFPKKEVKFTRHNLFERDRNTCQYCGRVFERHDLNLDHVIPRDRGGPTTWENIV